MCKLQGRKPTWSSIIWRHWVWPLILFLSFAGEARVQNLQRPKFAKQWIQVDGKRLHVELAETPQQQEWGLMYKKNLPEGEGMLFVFSDEKFRRFWMKNTFIPLSLGFFDRDGVLQEIADLDAVTSELAKVIPEYKSRFPARYVLEVNRGWFERNKVSIGARLVILGRH